MPSSPPKIGLALSGGAARGIAHVGVLRALAENDIPIDCIAGTSAGSIVAGSYAAGMPIEEIAEFGRKLRWRDIGRVTMSRLGIQSNERLEEYLRARLPITKFEDLPIPFAAVATDLKTNTAVVMKEQGDVPFAIRASCTIPGWYVPVVDEHERQLVDGGLVAVIPAVVTRSLGADIVIAVDVNSQGATFIGSSSSVIAVLLQSMMVVQKTASAYQLELSDFVISPKVGHIRWDEMGRADELMAAGYEAAIENIAKIREIIDSAATKEAQREEMLA
ncbi:MAG TPA: patatin-like phospholipase family protein [Pyrinomonadaceae bacterium]|jgi:NTE family protein|nr:patatin-like phospholipase family protein [Pyrinomonadaceae bacterium]